MMTDELWKDIPGLEGLYQVSSYGKVRNVKSNLLVEEKVRNGHPAVIIRYGGKIKQFSINKLVYSVFVEDTSKVVVPIDGNEFNHYYTNLRPQTNHIGEILNQKYKIIKEQHYSGTSYSEYVVKCMDCDKELLLKGNFNTIASRKSYKCNCYYKLNIGDIILNKYKILDKKIGKYHHCDYTIECMECGDILKCSSIKDIENKKSFNCSCHRNRKYKIGDVFGKIELIDKKCVHGTTKYYVKCVSCGYSKWVSSLNLTKFKSMKCNCNTPIRYSVGDIVLDKYKIIGIHQNTGHGCKYDVQCIECNDILKNRCISDKRKKQIEHFQCSCHYRMFQIGDILFEKYKIIDIINVAPNNKYIIQCVHCNKIFSDEPMSLYDITDNMHCACYDSEYDGVSIYQVMKIFDLMHKRCNTSSSYENISVVKYWNDIINFSNWYSENMKQFDLNSFNVPPNLPPRNYSHTVDRIDPRFEYSPYNCQILPWYTNSVTKRIADSKRSAVQLKLDKSMFRIRKNNWIKHMRKLGYSEEDLI